ncbi:unnamed protein product [Brassica rapa subsp. narinosa]
MVKGSKGRIFVGLCKQRKPKNFSDEISYKKTKLI